jgi:hypothetical protein
MIEWQAQPTGSGNHKRWEGERFLEEWASPSVLTGLKRSFVGYDAVAAEAALLSMMDFFSGLSAETGQLLGYDHMPSLALRVKGWIEKHRTAA